jgi:hypothetical protein
MFIHQNETLAAFSGHLSAGDRVAEREHRERHRQHAVDAHHRRVTVVGRQGGADLVVGHDRQVDQEPENASPDEIPEPNGHKKHHRPAMGERVVASGLLA